MSGGLVALLDDVATIAKLAASSLDDIGAAAGRAGAKAVGVVVDDTAVTPRYVAGFQPERELPVIWKIAKGSLFNKIVLILPAILLLSQFLPWALNPLLMLGGAYLCFEGAEKLYEALTGGHEKEAADAAAIGTPEHEKQMVSGAIRTDFILSAEIMVIALAEVAQLSLGMRAITLFFVALLITALVYGVVGLIVKMDDIGLKMARGRLGGTRAFGRSLVKGMPVVMSVLSVVGTAAMLWVGGHIIVAGLEKFGYGWAAHAIHHDAEAAAHAVPALSGMVFWLVETLGSAMVGLGLGAVIVVLMHLIPRKGGAAH
ncbi:DUF808 domain-containing protein [Deinococcus sp. VB142]|uniref:DUF808 domain-containing protein n=1 Tax=Deinococcus sp. VB142 TaxID=3112952 RepID=A0AAU6Q2V6_9DEIO